MSYSLKDIETSKFLVDPKDSNFVQKFNNKISFFKEVQELNGVEYQIDKKKVCTYIALAYDVNGLRKEIPEGHRVKREAGIAAEFPTTKDKRFEEAYENVILGKFDSVAFAIARYTAKQNNAEYTALVSYIEMLEAAQRESFNSVDQNLYKLIKGLHVDITESTNKLLSENEPVDILNALYSDIETQRTNLRAENIADKLSNGKHPLDGYSPYEDNGKSYHPSKMRYISKEGLVSNEQEEKE